MTVMVPVLFGVVMIGKLVDLKQTTEQAVRYAAWESTVHPSNSPNSLQPFAIKERFFGAPDNAIQSVGSEAGANRLWGEPGNNRVPQSHWQTYSSIEINEAGASGAPYQHGVGQSSIAMNVGQQIARSGEVLDGIADNEWGLSANGLVRSEVKVEVKQNDWLASADAQCGAVDVSGCVRSSSVILADGWSASDDGQASRRVKSLVPGSALEPVGDALSLVGVIPMFKELKGLKNAFGHVDMEALPAYAKP